jgi:hypothetical protein
MSPEQAVGLRSDLDPRDARDRVFLAAIDVWGLGATLYALLAGRPPFPVQPGSVVDPIALMEEVATANHQPLLAVAPEVPVRLARIVDAATAADPRDRYPGAAALAADLEAWLADRPTSRDRTWAQRALVHLWRERVRVGVIASLTFFVVLSSWTVGRNLATIEQQRSFIASQQVEVAALEETQLRLARNLNLAEQNLRDTRAELTNKSGIITVQEQELSAQSTDIERLNHELLISMSELTIMAEQAAESAGRISALEANRAQLESELDATGMHLDATLAERDAALRRARELQLAADRDASRNREFDNALQQLRVEADRAQSFADSARVDLAISRAKLATAEARVLELEDELTSLRTTTIGP